MSLLDDCRYLWRKLITFGVLKSMLFQNHCNKVYANGHMIRSIYVEKNRVPHTFDNIDHSGSGIRRPRQAFSDVL